MEYCTALGTASPREGTRARSATALEASKPALATSVPATSIHAAGGRRPAARRAAAYPQPASGTTAGRAFDLTDVA
jgi:hypothetical protein